MMTRKPLWNDSSARMSLRDGGIQRSFCSIRAPQRSGRLEVNALKPCGCKDMTPFWGEVGYVSCNEYVANMVI